MRVSRLRCARAQSPVIVALGAGLASFVGGPVSAADLYEPVAEVAAAPAKPVPAWKLSIAPYFWAAGMSGTVASFGAPGVDVDMNFSDILSDLDFSVMLAGEARYGRFSLTTDLLYLKLSTKETTPRGILASNVSLGSSTTEFTALAGYSVLDLPNARLDVVGGARVWSVENKLSFNGGLLNGRTFKDSETWVDAMGGLKGRVDLSDKVYLTGMALGGGGSSDFAWDLLGGLGYEITDRISAIAGYRAIGVDYQNGPFDFDVTIQGPIIGASITF
ncbi:opacity protein-like surface antigen [Amorphus suaedae]